MENANMECMKQKAVDRLQHREDLLKISYDDRQWVFAKGMVNAFWEVGLLSDEEEVVWLQRFGAIRFSFIRYGKRVAK